MTAPFLFAVVKILFFAAASEVLIVAPAGDPSVSDVPDPACGSHCWRRSEAHGTWHEHMRILHTADF